jgi:adenylosuccinate lyase
MSGHGLVSEGFAAGQVGSSAMPHKVNPRVSERINSLAAILKGLVTMANEISGEQWNEGDVSCSATRRVVLPETAYVIDGILDSTISVLDGIQINEKEIKAEMKEHLPLMSTSRLLMLSVKKGVGREQAHGSLKHHAHEWRNRNREEANVSFFEKVIQDVDLKLEAKDIEAIISAPLALAGDAPQQARKMSGRIKEIPDLEVSRSYSPAIWS